jgi:hypothetical protein
MPYVQIRNISIPINCAPFHSLPVSSMVWTGCAWWRNSAGSRKSLRQYLQTMAWALIVSAQNGHNFVSAVDGGGSQAGASGGGPGDTAATFGFDICAGGGPVRRAPQFGHEISRPAPAASITIPCPHAPQLNVMSIRRRLRVASILSLRPVRWQVFATGRR